MIYTKAAMEDIDQLTELRIAYLAEDHGELAEKDLEIIKPTEAGYQLYKSLGFRDAASKYHQMNWSN